MGEVEAISAVVLPPPPRVFVEVLGRHDHVASRVELSRFPAKIGRGYQCDVIIDDDARISSMHCTIERGETGNLTLIDENSATGTFREGVKDRIINAEIGTELLFRIGRTRVRVRTGDFSVAKTEVIDRYAPSIFERAAVLPIMLSLLLGFETLATWLSTYEKFEDPLTENLIGAVVIIAVWSAGWAIVSKMTHHRGRYLAHASVVTAAMLFFGAVNFVSSEVAYLFGTDVDDLIPWIAASGALAFALEHHLRLAAWVADRRTRIVALISATTVVGMLFTLDNANSRRFKEDFPSYSPRLEPPPFRVVTEKPIDTAFGDLEGLKEELDALALEPPD